MKKYIIEGKMVESENQFHEYVKGIFDFEDYGNNLDSLWDLLNEYDSLEIELRDVDYIKEKLGDYGDRIEDLFEDLSENYSVKIRRRKMIRDYLGKKPTMHEDTWVAENAMVVGDVTLGEGVGVWFSATVRGDDQPIVIGKHTNVQDSVVIHVNLVDNCTIGDYVTLGHGAIVHACTIGNNTIIGMGSIILDGAKVGDNCIIGAGAVVPPGKEIPDNSLVVGNPAKIVRQTTEAEIEMIRENAEIYYRKLKDYR